MGTYYGKNWQHSLDKKAGKPLEYLPAGLRNANLKCSTETFTAPELIPDGSQIMVSNLTADIVPAFAIIEATKDMAGCIGTAGRLALFGVFIARANVPTLIMPASPNEPLKTGGDVFIKTAGDFPIGGKVNIKLFYTRD